MSEHLTHVAVYEDCYNMIQHSGNRFTKAFRESTEKAFDSGLFCSGSRGNHLFAVPILEKNRDLYHSGKATSETLEQIAGAIGWITHRAADLQMKPLFNAIDELNVEPFYSDECQMYHDAEVFRQVFDGGKKTSVSPYSYLHEATLSSHMKPHPAVKHLNADVLENNFTHYILYELLTTKVFIDQEENVEKLAEKIIGQSQDLYEDLRIYIRAFEEPEPLKQMGYITRPNFYDPNDHIIQFVRYAQEHNKPHPSINLDESLDLASNQSHYAQALKKGYNYLFAASEFFDGKIEKSKLYDSVENFNPNHRI